MEIDYAADYLTGTGPTYTETAGPGSPAGASVDVAGAPHHRSRPGDRSGGATVAITAGFVLRRRAHLHARRRDHGYSYNSG